MHIYLHPDIFNLAPSSSHCYPPMVTVTHLWSVAEFNWQKNVRMVEYSQQLIITSREFSW